jgi:hypothetical protein
MITTTEITTTTTETVFYKNAIQTHFIAKMPFRQMPFRPNVVSNIIPSNGF